MNISETLENAIAIVGMAGRFPGARNIDEFWQNLRGGVESISFFSEEDAIASGMDPQLLRHPGYVNAHGAMEGIEYFDASFFGFSPREAEMMDPQYRVFLECAWEALEHAGYDTTTYKGRIGVYAGSSMNAYANLLLLNRDLMASVGIEQFLQGNAKDYLATRVSYKLDLRGPAIAIQTACSTSLVAVHLACQSLINGECDMALAGGVSVAVPQKAGRIYQEGGITSPDGHCRAFSAGSQGVVGGSGVGIVVLKSLREALKDGDSIYAVIRGSAVNNDGASKVGYMAPSVTGQAQVIVEAQALAEVDPGTITYIEAHGTGTPLGDPIEIAALTQAFRAATQKKGYCAIGSVKTNIGHLDAAAGVAGLIKAVLALKHRLIPPSLNFSGPNLEIDFASSPFYVNTRLSEWSTGNYPRRAGVSSFGIGGTNAHVVLEEAPEAVPVGTSRASRPWQLLLLSAKSSSTLEAATANLSRYLEDHPDLHLADVAYTFQNGRRAFSHRRMAVCSDAADAVAVLETRDPRRLFSAVQESRNRPVVFMFPGTGAQYSNMGLELYLHEPAFRKQVDRCVELLKPHLGLDLGMVLYPAASQAETAARQLRRTSLALPALFATEYALAKLWMSWGVRPQAMIGHSLGEYVAACLAGVFSLPDALALVALRGRLFDQLPEGAMLSVPLSAEELEPLMQPGLSLAAINGPSLCVVAGAVDAIAAMEAMLLGKGLEVRRVPIEAALHSSLVEPILGTFTRFVERLGLQAPVLPYVSNVTGTWITAQEATSPDYWATHLRRTVHFAAGVRTLLQEPSLLLLEVGPGHTLSMLARQQIEHMGQHAVFSSLGSTREQKSEQASLLTTVGQLWLAGAHIDWSGFSVYEHRRRIPLPTYPFERQRYWVEPRQQTAATSQKELRGASRDGRRVYMSSWKRAALALVDWEDLAGQEQRWLVFGGEGGLAPRIMDRLRDHGQQVISVTAGPQFRGTGEESYTLDPRSFEDYAALLTELAARNQLSAKFIHLWGVTPGDQVPGEHFDLGFGSLLLLARALADQPGPFEIVVVSDCAQEVTGAETLYPEKAAVLGPCQVISQEYPSISCRAVDIELPTPGAWQEEQLLDCLLAEFAAGSPDPVVAYRGNHRWVEVNEEVGLAPVKAARLRQGGCYLVVDGPADPGSLLIEGLARALPGRLVIVEPLAFPPRDTWEQWLAGRGETAWIAERIRQLQALEEEGIKVLVLSADLTDRADLQRVVDQAYERSAVIHGVISIAGFVEDAFFSTIRQAQPGVCEDYLRAKMTELVALEQALQGKKLDFCLLCSPLSSVFGGKGGAVGVAVGRLIDTFVNRHNQTSPSYWRSVAWDTWQLSRVQARRANSEPALTPAEVAETLGGLASTLATRLLVLAGDLQTRCAAWLEHEPVRASAQPVSAGSTSLHPRPDLQTSYVAPSNEIEQMIAVLWQELLGIEPVGIYDNFFELGGHSLMAAKFIARLREALLLEVPVKSIFESPTIAGVASIAEQLFVEKIEQLSEEEAERLMSNVFHHD